MKMSKLFVQTLREYPSDAEVISHKLLVRAGYIRKLTSGVYNYLPLMWRVLKKIENIVREEMDNAGAKELLMPFVQPKELWEESGRWDVYGKELMRLRDRHNREMCPVSYTHLKHVFIAELMVQMGFIADRDVKSIMFMKEEAGKRFSLNPDDIPTLAMEKEKFDIRVENTRLKEENEILRQKMDAILTFIKEHKTPEEEPKLQEF